MIASYCRVSSKNQDLATQEAAIERAARARGDVIEPAGQYKEKRSAHTLARPELGRLRADARAGKISRLYVYRLDRLARSGIRDTFEVVEELKRHGVELVSVSDGFDLSGPTAEVVLAVMAWAAQMERLAIRERVSATIERVKAEGRSWGRPMRLRPAEIERARQLRAQGLSVRAIAISMKVPRSTIGRAIACPK